MIEEVLRYLNNYFIVSGHVATGGELTTITLTHTDKLIPGQYIYVKDSLHSDGVYQIDTVSDGQITTFEEIRGTIGKCKVYGLSIPKNIEQLASEIQEYSSKVSTGVKSEKLGDYSVTYGDANGWQGAFSSRLAPYRKVYLRWPHDTWVY